MRESLGCGWYEVLFTSLVWCTDVHILVTDAVNLAVPLSRRLLLFACCFTFVSVAAKLLSCRDIHEDHFPRIVYDCCSFLFVSNTLWFVFLVTMLVIKRRPVSTDIADCIEASREAGGAAPPQKKRKPVTKMFCMFLELLWIFLCIITVVYGHMY